MNLAWFTLILAGCFEVGFTFCLGKAKGQTYAESWPWYLGFLLSLCLSMLLLMKASKVLPLGTAYAVWTGIGALGTSLIGIFIFKEPVHFWRLFCLFLLIASVIGLKLTSEH